MPLTTSGAYLSIVIKSPKKFEENIKLIKLVATGSLGEWETTVFEHNEYYSKGESGVDQQLVRAIEEMLK